MGKRSTMSTWIPLLVRQEDYAEFANRVAEREAGREDSVLLTLAGSGAVAAGFDSTKEFELLAELHTWSVEALTKFADSAATYVTVDRWCKAMDVMCDHIGQDISSDELAEEARMPINQWRDAPRKLPGHLARHYEPNLRFPLIGRSGRDLKKDDQVYWSIAPEQARRWLQVRAHAEAPGVTATAAATTTVRR